MSVYGQFSLPTTATLSPTNKNIKFAMGAWVTGRFVVNDTAKFENPVGIGTSTPSYKLDLLGSFNAVINNNVITSDASGIEAYTRNNTDIVLQPTHGSDGNVGVGTSSPVAKLTVISDSTDGNDGFRVQHFAESLITSTIIVADNNINITNEKTDVSTYLFGTSFTGESVLVTVQDAVKTMRRNQTDGVFELIDELTGATYFFVDTNHVGINTNAPTEWFEVNGDTQLDSLLILPNLITEADTAGTPLGTLYRDSGTNAVFWKP